MLWSWRMLFLLFLPLPDVAAQPIKWHSSTTMLCSKLEHYMMGEHNMVVVGCASVQTTGEFLFSGAFSMDVIARSAFSITLPKMDLGWKFICFHTFPTKLRQLFKIHITDREATQSLKNIALAIMEQRRNNGQAIDDFLQLLLNAAAENEQRIPDQ